jgi:probable O-glycosylation ligase (exosortase A-associated)
VKGVLITYFLSYGGAAASLFRPFIGLMVCVCFSIVRPDSMWAHSLPRGNYSRTVAIGLVAGWALGGFGSWRLGRAGAVVGALVGFWAWAAIGVLNAPDPGLAFEYLELVTKIVLPVLVGITTIDSVAKLRWLAWVIALSLGYVAFEMNLSYLQGYNRVHEEGHGGFDNNCVAITMDCGIGVAFFLGLESRRWWAKLVALGTAMLMAHVVLFSFSRGGQLGMILSATVASLLIRKQPKHYLAFALAVLLVVWLAGPDVRERFMTTFATAESRDSSAQSRLDIWGVCSRLIADRPVFGASPRHWLTLARDYGSQYDLFIHNLWLQVAAELGLPGLLLLVSSYGICMARVWPMARADSPVPDPFLRTAARMVISALSGFALSSQFVSADYLEVPYYVVLLGAGALKLASGGPGAGPPGACGPRPRESRT